jgi:hypothetical protein
MYDAINKGMRMATGDILAYLNSDDLYFPWTLEVVVEAFDRRPDADLVSGDCVRVDPSRCRSYLLFQPPPYTDYVTRTGYLAQPTVFWRRRVLEDVGEFDESLKYVADCDFWMRALPRHRLNHVREFLAVDTIQPAALRSSMAARLAEETAGVRGRYVHLQGPAHHLRAAANRTWGAFWRRAYWVTLLTQRQLASRRAPRYWRRWLDTTDPDISVAYALLAQLPVVGRRYAWQALRPAETLDG